MNHTVTIRPNPHAHNSRFKFENVCTCQWQMLCFSVEIADSHAAAHLRYHRVPDVQSHIVRPEVLNADSSAVEGSEAPAPLLEEPRPLYHPESTLKPKVLAGVDPKALDGPKV